MKGGSALAPLGQLGTPPSLLVPNSTQLPYADDVEEIKQGKDHRTHAMLCRRGGGEERGGG